MDCRIGKIKAIADYHPGREFLWVDKYEVSMVFETKEELSLFMAKLELLAAEDT